MPETADKAASRKQEALLLYNETLYSEEDERYIADTEMSGKEEVCVKE
ncbi:MAG: hypothetical protein HC887_00315 [Desulfobacteraceae bacterium]|nr:hypothetical protein [Desulfobacteraceae bacterium]